MYGPNTPSEEPEEMLPEWHEPFPEPNPFPSGWTFSSGYGAPTASSALDSEESAED
jgi:hypothetical protein